MASTKIRTISEWFPSASEDSFKTTFCSFSRVSKHFWTKWVTNSFSSANFALISESQFGHWSTPLIHLFFYAGFYCITQLTLPLLQSPECLALKTMTVLCQYHFRSLNPQSWVSYTGLNKQLLPSRAWWRIPSWQCMSTLHPQILCTLCPEMQSLKQKPRRFHGQIHIYCSVTTKSTNQTLETLCCKSGMKQTELFLFLR